MSIEELGTFLQRHTRLTVLSGAGCSTDSGIPDYRDPNGNWKGAEPMHFPEFIRHKAARRRYWARSFAGWPRMSEARPNAVHAALVSMENASRISCLITQNVDNLHRIAGSRKVIDLHGVVHRVRCLGCDITIARDRVQRCLETLNPGWQSGVASYGPDGDAFLNTNATDAFEVPDCEHCGGILKPDVVFFGEHVPRERVQEAHRHLVRSDALLVIGSSLMVWSGFRFARLAVESGKPLAIINRGRTRADDLAECKVDGGCAETLLRLMPVLLPEDERASHER
jgi:NAD-dependent SIR2 family protein deacetylase